VLLCGRYEGVDQRVVEARGMREISSATTSCPAARRPPWSCSTPACASCPASWGAAESAVEESFAADGLLEYPHYTRPAEWNGLRVPEVLLSGHHADVARWRRAEAERATRERRPDLWARRAPAIATAAASGRGAAACRPPRRRLNRLREGPSP
jgi:tRNA (guanine37-N1)-methyltransferase